MDKELLARCFHLSSRSVVLILACTLCRCLSFTSPCMLLAKLGRVQVSDYETQLLQKATTHAALWCTNKVAAVI
jgi:hypothetical protein